MKIEEVVTLQDMFGCNFIGPEQIDKLLGAMGLPLLNEEDIPEMNFPMEVLKTKSKDYLLVMGYAGDADTPLNIFALREKFGINPDIHEPCFYNQDWYLAENFINKTLEKRWYLVKKEVLEDTRAIMPDELSQRGVRFPSAILCTYAFFSYYYSYGQHLWFHDFVWCSDVDHNGDRIYVGKYHDIDGVNKNGFSIHRHLALRDCYASVDSF